MKRKTIVLFVMVSFLLSAFFIGCDNGTTNSNYDFIDVPVNPPFEYIPVDPIAPPYENIPTLNNYDAIFMGEGHTNRENFVIYPALMKYYYSLGIRDFAIEAGYGSMLLLQYYLESGNEECLELYFRNTKGTQGCSQESYNFYKEIYRWNSTLGQKIRLHSFDIEHQYHTTTPQSAIYLYILRKYPKIEGIPSMTAPGTVRELISDFRNNKTRYSSISADDMKLLERIIANNEQGLDYYANGGAENTFSSSVVREQYMIDNFRQILKDTKGRKVFAIM